MSFKETPSHFQMLDVSLIAVDPARARQNIDEASLKGLANSIQMKGLIHPLLVQPADAAGRHTLIVGERRWRAAVLAGEKSVPVLIRPCPAEETLEIQIFENLGLGMRAALEPRDMANAIQKIADRFETREAAAEHFGRNAAWLTQATAAANLSAKVSALLDSGKISSTGAAVQLEKLAQKNEGKAETLIGQIQELPEGKKLSKKTVDNALSEEGGRRKKKEEAQAALAAARAAAAQTPEKVTQPSAQPVAGEVAPLAPWEDAPAAAPAARRRVNPNKVEQVARILGLADSDEEEILVQLIDAFLTLKGEDAASL
jgi:ParB family chromosome partitioning protein